MTESKQPKVFISYAWEEDTKIWAREFAARLRSDGIDTILDQWHVIPGDLLPEFMEKSVSESDFVLVICTPAYKRKSESEHPSGVVYEKGVITGELFVKRNQRKFIPILQEGEWSNSAPSWILAKTYIDLSDNPYSENNYMDLLRTLYSERELAPPLGSKPDFSKPVTKQKKRIKPAPTKEKSTSPSTVEKLKEIIKADLKKVIAWFAIFGFALLVLYGLASLSPQTNPSPETAFTQIEEVTQNSTATIEIAPSATFTIPAPSETSTPTLTPTKVNTPTATPYPEEISDIDPAGNEVPMRLVPAGEFTMGNNDGYDWEKPAHQVYLDTYYIDKYEVSNILFKACVEAKVCDVPESSDVFLTPGYYESSKFDNFPVVNVSWEQSKTYCKWREKALPNEAQWEKAARGTDLRDFPWGWRIDCSYANYHSNCQGSPAEVGSYSRDRSPYNVHDLAGNVGEWVADWYDNQYYKTLENGVLNPIGPLSGTARVWKGGTWFDSGYGLSTVSKRSSFGSFPNDGRSLVGFRCAISAP